MSELRPTTKFLNNSEYEQFRHLESEFHEVKREFHNRIDYKLYKEGLSELARHHLTIELVDLQMSAETMLAILGLDEQKRGELRLKVIAKNEARGYYKEG